MQPNGFVTYLKEDIFNEIEGVTFRSMFGGWGIYKDGFFFALVDDDKLYFKVDETNKPDFEAFDCQPFVYTAKGKTQTMNYYEVPEAVIEDRTEFPDWVEKAVAVAVRSKKK